MILSQNSIVSFLQFLAVLLVGLACRLTVSESSNIKCIDSERRALLNFKKDLVDEANLLLSWTSKDEYCCGWRGIGCSNQTGHVVMIDLHSEMVFSGITFPMSKMRGNISSSLLELPYLSHLDLSINAFTTIPEFIGSLGELTYLNLSNNGITGTIPNQLGSLSKLRYLDLSFNGKMRADNLEWLTHLSSLTTLNMSGVNFVEAVDWLQSIKMLPSLKTLELHSCQFPDQIIPPSLSHVNSSNSLMFLYLSGNVFNTSLLPLLFNISTKLVKVSLASCHLNGPLPEYGFYNMSSLVHLDLFANEIVGGIPKSFGNLCSLKRLDLSRNNLNGSLPDLLKNLTTGCTKNSLEILRLNLNKLRGSFPDITGFSSLRELYLDYNQLDGTFSKISHHSSNLHVLNLDQNQLEGSLPDLSNFTSLRELHVSENKLNGSFSIGDISANLRILDVSSNYLIGVISEDHFLNLSELKELDLSFTSLALNFNSEWIPPFQLVSIKLSSCKLGPWFPSWLRMQRSVTYLDISNSGISDAIPNWFWNLSSKIQNINLSNNNISAKVPNLPLKFENSPAIDLSYNLFDGSIPLFFSTASKLDLSNNKFQGSLSFLCTTIDNAQAYYMDLSNNLLIGEIPECWMHWESLRILNLKNNNFTGKIPMSIGFLVQLQSLNLRNNSLSGKLPLSLKNCSGLKLLDLGENKLSGEVSAWIWENLQDLIVLRLRSNNFYGGIPSNLCNLKSLQVLDLSLNNISGSIPPCFSNLTAMVQTKALDHDISTYVVSYPWQGSPWPFISNVTVMVLVPYVDVTSVVWKGVEQEYGKNLRLLRVIDISSNQLSGEIPEEITSLLGLITLNLSRNNFIGAIPKEIGKLKLLESLDLSRNQLSAEIPTSLADSTFLSYLDLSSNNLSGRIPRSTQLQSFNASQYMGNSELCGLPLPTKCPGDETIQDSPRMGDSKNNTREGDEWFDRTLLYAGMGAGFFTGFVVVFGAILFSDYWRHAFFKFLNNMVDWLYLTVALNMAKLKRRFQS